jgi:hypothetical protein
MQCMWFELESGRRCARVESLVASRVALSRMPLLCSFLRRKEYGKALKKFQAIDKVRLDGHE